jgi:hypothetical protein
MKQIEKEFIEIKGVQLLEKLKQGKTESSTN